MLRCQYDAVFRGRNRDTTIPLETPSNLVLDVLMTRAPVLFLLALLVPATALTRPRLLVLTDITNEPDDEQSMVRLLCYANELEIEGLIATTSCWLRNRTAPDRIVERIEAYRQVRENLTVHAGGWPEADDLLQTVKQGVPKFGMEGV
ncbi:MAG: nucleoside hydrolase-like domain-containing protein, partial [Verrucomicrobiota bacterium]|nr:nucleoside hydrolase-like domain-containing protein [Verrucomicrobiota bacterium]